MKLFPVRIAILAILTTGLALAPAGRTRAVAQEPKKDNSPAQAKEKIMVWVEKFFDSYDCPLETELTINGKSVGKFQSNTQKDVSDLIKPGTNVISFTTTPQEPATANNSLTFRLGPVTTNAKTKKTVMKPILVVFRNEMDWKLNEDTGKFTHPFGPNPKTPAKKSVTVSYNFSYAGVAPELAEVKEGDYVLQMETFFQKNPSVLATVSVNGKSVGSFQSGQRSLVITDLLKPGENEIKLATEAITTQLEENATDFGVIGPMTYHMAQQKFLGKEVVQFKALEGWTRDKTTGVMHVKGKPGTTTHERTIRFNLDAK